MCTSWSLQIFQVILVCSIVHLSSLLISRSLPGLRVFILEWCSAKKKLCPHIICFECAGSCLSFDSSSSYFEYACLVLMMNCHIIGEPNMMYFSCFRFLNPIKSTFWNPLSQFCQLQDRHLQIFHLSSRILIQTKIAHLHDLCWISKQSSGFYICEPLCKQDKRLSTHAIVWNLFLQLRYSSPKVLRFFFFFFLLQLILR